MNDAILDGQLDALLSRERRWRAAVPTSWLLVPCCAVSGALLLSTQFLVQPYVWANFELVDILHGWLVIFRDRLIVTALIAIALLATFAVKKPGASMSAVLVCAAIVAGSFAGETIAARLGFEPAAPLSRVVMQATARWIVVGFAVAGIVFLYRRIGEGRTAVHEASLRSARIDRQTAEARLQLLRAQIEPHFLFNTLATIRRLHLSDPSTGAAMLGDFIDYLRASIPRTAGEVATLGDEIALVRAYLGLVAVRMSGRLSWSMDVDASLTELPFPALSLATLAENAIKHGIVPSDRGGHVQLVVRRSRGAVEASVIDDGIGLGDASGGTGIGLANTRARLVSSYGPAARLDLMRNEPRGVRATIRFPA